LTVQVEMRVALPEPVLAEVGRVVQGGAFALWPLPFQAMGSCMRPAAAGMLQTLAVNNAIPLVIPMVMEVLAGEFA
jgi:hypothetical protein